jgi:hypothetical protein
VRINYKKIILAGVSLYLFWGCAGSSPSVHCTPEMIRAGYFCYGGRNFGKNLSPEYKRGVIDGCRTGQGYFFKDYEAYQNSISYKNGWIQGRKKCRPVYDEQYMNRVSRNPPPPDEASFEGLASPEG